MTIDLVEKELKRFLASSEPEVLCIHGKWGVGKTFIWKAKLDEAVANNKVGLGWYAYVSLFGITSLDRLKYAIAENMVERRHIGKDRDLEITKDNLTSRVRLWLHRHGPAFLRIGGDELASLVERLAFLSVTKTLICFDDLERKGDGLAMKDLLGLVAQLKEEKACKVILLLNDDALDGDSEKEFELLREKVIDESIEFAPEASDSVRVALIGEDQSTQLLRERVIELGISNIRVIKKIERLLSRATPLLRQFHPRVLQQAVHSLALFGWSFYSREGAPTLDFLLHKRGQAAFNLGNVDSDLDDESKELTDEDRWNALLDRYEFGSADEFDLALLDGVRRGFFDEKTLEKHAKELDNMFNASDGQKTLEAAWRPFHDSFDTNDAEVIDGIVTAFRDNIRRVAPGTLNATVKLLKRTGRSEKAAELLAYYMDHRREAPEFFDLSRDSFGHVDDPDIRNAFDARYETGRTRPSPEDVLLRIARSDSWSEEGMVVLAEQTADDFCRIFKNQTGEDLFQIVRTVLQLERTQGDGHEQRVAITARAKEALARIGKESPLNKARVAKWGIQVE